MKHIFIILFFMTQCYCGFSQKYMTQSGSISFFSEAPIENIESTNNQVSSVVNLENGQLAFSLLMKAFVFEKALMQAHFNEKYVESEIFPKAIFKGQIQNFDKSKVSSVPQKVIVKGNLTIHGETKETTAVGQIYFNDKKQLAVNSKFEINLDDFKIKIPSAVKENISKNILISILMQYEKLD